MSCNGKAIRIASGSELVEAAHSLVGDLILHVHRRPLSRDDRVAAAIQAAWAGYLSRRELFVAATGGAPCAMMQDHVPGSPTIRSPPRLSFGDQHEEPVAA